MKCFACNVVESVDFTLSGCQVCRNVLYCSKDCQKEDWKRHKKICKSLVVGQKGSMQLRHAGLANLFEAANALCDTFSSIINEDEFEQFFKLFRESTPGGRTTAAQEMKQIVRRLRDYEKKIWIILSLRMLVRVDSARLKWLSSPLLVLLECMDPTALPLNELTSWLAGMTSPDAYPETDAHRFSAHQLILAEQLFEYGIDLNDEIATRATSLNIACNSNLVTNLEFIYLLLQHGADPNAMDHEGQTPLARTIQWAPSAAKVLIEWPTTNVNIVNQSGVSMLTIVHILISEIAVKVDISHENSRRAQDVFLLEQWREVEKMLVEKGAQ
jgi:hypothetical protein